MTPDVSDSLSKNPEITNCYNKTKSEVDTMIKMLAEFTVKLRTNRWLLAFFFSILLT